MERRCHHAQYYECNCGPCAGRENQRCYEELQQRNCDNERKKRRVLGGESLLRGQGSGPFALSAATNHGRWPPASYDPARQVSTRTRKCSTSPPANRGRMIGGGENEGDFHVHRDQGDVGCGKC